MPNCIANSFPLVQSQKYLGWKSLLVEANPMNFEQLEKNRPNAQNVHAAVCPGEKGVEFIWTSDKWGKSATGGVKEDMFEGHQNAWVRPDHNTETVPCRTWGELFKASGITHVDIFVIDVEGAELTVLSVMDWSVTVDYFIIEMIPAEEAKERNQQIRELLGEHGYKEMDIKLKDWCLPNKDCTWNTLFSKGE